MISRLLFATCATVAGTLSTLHAATTWNAATDFLANELGTDSNPNGAWTYGYRDLVSSTSVTPFVAGDHKTAIGGNANFEGWQLGAGFLMTATNTSSLTIGTLLPGELLVHPLNAAANPTYNVIRWTAPTTGDYTIAFNWRVGSTLVNATNDGVDAHVVHSNGTTATAIFNTIVSPGQFVSNSNAITLTAGHTIDFVVGPGTSGINENDSTIFNATITLVPEPSSALLLGAAVPLCFLRRRNKAAC